MKNRLIKYLKYFFGTVLLILVIIIYFDIDIFPKGNNADTDNSFISQANKLDSTYLTASTEMFKALGDESLINTPELKNKISKGLLILKKTLKETEQLDPPKTKTLKVFEDEYARQREREISAFERLIVAINTGDKNLYNNSIDDIKIASKQIEIQEHSLFD